MGHTPETRARAYKKMVDRRSSWLAANGPCRKCGSSEKLEVHHIHPEDKVSHVVWSWSVDRMMGELAKCVVLCSNCHLKETAEYNRRPLIHGTSSAYKRGCRCHDCTKANSNYVASWRIGRFGVNSSGPRVSDLT